MLGASCVPVTLPIPLCESGRSAVTDTTTPLYLSGLSWNTTTDGLYDVGSMIYGFIDVFKNF